MKVPAYIDLANKMAEMIEQGVFKPGDKLPSLRSLHKENGLSIGTLLQAFNYLLDKGLISSREKSGYYVSHHSARTIPAPLPLPVSLSEKTVHIDALLQKLQRESNSKKFVSFANALPDHRLLPFNSIKRAIQHISRDTSGSYLALEDRKGNGPLREAIAQRSFLWKGLLHADDLLITNGAKEAIICCLTAVTQPGDTVLVQDPCYHGILQAIECLNLKVATIPSHPETGIELADLKAACHTLTIKACILVSNFNNPDGASLDTDKKKQIAAFAEEQQIPVIEDDLYGEIFFNGSRPDTIKAYDHAGWVLYCSSFTKSLVPGFRIGWCAPGRFAFEVTRVKSMHNGSTSGFSQQVVQQLLYSGTYDRHLQKFRLELHKNLVRMTGLIERFFPKGTKISRPEGGLVLWVQLPAGLNAVLLQDIAFRQEVAYAPGELFSADGGYRNYLRISYCNWWSAREEKAIIKLGQVFTAASRDNLE